MLPVAFPDKVTPDIDFTDESVVQDYVEYGNFTQLLSLKIL